MTPYEIMLSESQERMLMVLEPGQEDAAARIFGKWELDLAVVGRLTNSGRLVLRAQGEVVADIPIERLVEGAPRYAREMAETAPRPVLDPGSVPAPAQPLRALERLLATPDLAAKRWIWEQYDRMVMADTVPRPGADAAVVRVHGTGKGLALTSDCTPRYCRADPRRGGAQAVAEAWRNLTAVGARPLALTDCLNFGSPERPEIMGQFVGCIEGMGEACRALDFPVVSGNVSFYNETNGEAILPTPTIGGVGLLAEVAKAVGIGLGQEGQALVLVGEGAGWLGCSLYVRDLLGRDEGAPPPVDLAAERRNGDFVRGLIDARRVSCCHDLSDGGLLVALAEMALAGDMGAEITPPDNGGEAATPLHGWLFGEDQGRYLLATGDPDAVLAGARAAGVPARRIGTSGGKSLKIAGVGAISIDRLRAAHEGWLPAYMAAP